MRRPTRLGLATFVAVAPVLLAIAAFMILAVVPTVESTRSGMRLSLDPRADTRTEQRRETLLTENGRQRAAFLLAPAAVAVVPLALSRTRARKPASVVAAVLTWLYVVATGFSVGLLYAPVVVAHVAAAARTASAEEPRADDETNG